MDGKREGDWGGVSQLVGNGRNPEAVGVREACGPICLVLPM